MLPEPSAVVSHRSIPLPLHYYMYINSTSEAATGSPKAVGYGSRELEGIRGGDREFGGGERGSRVTGGRGDGT